MMGYINMDAAYITGHKDFAGMVAFYTTRVSTKALRELLIEIEQYRAAHPEDLSQAFLSEFDYGAYIEDVRNFLDITCGVVSDVIATAEGRNEQKAVADKPQFVDVRVERYLHEPDKTVLAYVISDKFNSAFKRQKKSHHVLYKRVQDSSDLIYRDFSLHLSDARFASSPQPTVTIDAMSGAAAADELERIKSVYGRLSEEYVRALEKRHNNSLQRLDKEGHPLYIKTSHRHG
ncbi:hypothetical protein CYR52_05075 [Chimaeribacter arupi]|nr:hypothetical protein CYR52_05075 [Chimaeribacter arupi]